MRAQVIELYLVSFLTRCLLWVLVVVVTAVETVVASFVLVGIISIVGLSVCKVILYKIKVNF
jgi:hypothetical protein